jgi:hypothetical protein
MRRNRFSVSLAGGVFIILSLAGLPPSLTTSATTERINSQVYAVDEDIKPKNEVSPGPQKHPKKHVEVL